MGVDGHLDECGLCGVCLLAFFFILVLALFMCMTQPLSRCGVVDNPCVLDRFFVFVCGCELSLIHCCPGSVRVTGYIFRVLLLRPRLWFVYPTACRDVSPGINVVRWVLVVVRQTSFFAMLIYTGFKWFT